MLQLKGYQEKALESLRKYLRACDDLQDSSLAFYKVTEELWGQGLPYRAIKEPSELADIPYVCLRLPTGGGKTLLACHSVSLANREYLKRENSLVLWLVPSNAIKDQTINALMDRDHAYRQALEGTLGPVTVINLAEALYLQQAVLLDSTVIIIATLQAFRVEDQEGRKVYEGAGALLHHFQDLPNEITDKLEHGKDGILVYSLANVMRIHRPLVIVDEAHNARTELSFDTLARFRPSAIIEFTATPDSSKNPSNVLHSVSAAELKAENMIKLPIRLETQSNWQALLSDAIAHRSDLESKADIELRKTGDYIRPIMLLQAQPRRQGKETLTVDVIERSLIEDHRIPKNQIARATGEDKDLEGVNLWDKQCAVRYVITVQALREGWDCPFAYVLCSLAEQRSLGAVEQILGRILRLPYCKPRDAEDLNKAYAFVSSSNFAEAAQTLVDALIENGFNRQEAQDFIKPAESAQPSFGFQYRPKVPPSKVITLAEVPDPERLSTKLKDKIDIDQENRTITLKNVIYGGEETEVKNLLVAHDVKEVWVREVRKYNAEIMEIFKTPSERQKPFDIPLLCIRRGEQFESFEEDHLLERGWDLNSFDPKLNFQEFSALKAEIGQYGEIDVGTNGKVKSKFIPDLNRHLQLIEVIGNWTDTRLIQWLDRGLLFIDISSQEKEIFLTAMVSDLLDAKGIALGQLVRKKFELRRIVEEKIKTYRKQAKERAYQELLFGERADEVVVSPEKCLSFHPDQYPCRYSCPASDSFLKHYYPKVGELDDKGEEFLCAQFIDQMEEVEFWVRNLERQERFSFWLQTGTDKFYPDFVCQLKDGRYLVVEYKGADRWSNDDSKDKRRLGELWALKSGGQCLFIMPKGKDWEAIKLAVNS